VNELVAAGYRPGDFYSADEELRAVVDWAGSNYFTSDEPPGILSPLRENLLYHDPFLCLADYHAYSECQKNVSAAFLDKPRWAKMAILNTARVGKFSSDRTISEYARDIWNLSPVEVKPLAGSENL